MAYPPPKSEWGPGPWQDEPDEATWVDPATGYTCQILRNTEVTGALNGYVFLPGGHPFWGKPYGDLPADINPHGGVSYARETLLSTGAVYRIGFDCSHAWDIAPLIDAARRSYGRGYTPPDHDVYRDWAYVQAEVEELARALKSHEGEAK